MLYLTNAFSINMLSNYSNSGCVTDLSFTPISAVRAKILLSQLAFTPAIGHQDTAAIVAKDLDLDKVPFNRISVALDSGDNLIVAQYTGPRLPEGTTTLPDGAKITYWLVE